MNSEIDLTNSGVDRRTRFKGLQKNPDPRTCSKMFKCSEHSSCQIVERLSSNVSHTFLYGNKLAKFVTSENPKILNPNLEAFPILEPPELFLL